MNYELLETATQKEFLSVSVETLTKKINAAIADHDSCIVGLSGGSTPGPIYEMLSRENLNWSKMRFFLVDERHIAPDHADSNARLVREMLLANIPVSAEQVVFPDTTLALEECMVDYSKRLKEQWKNQLPDIVILGLGEDGHIASLFPPLSDEAMSDQRLVLHTETDRFAVHDRISISLNAIAAAENQIFFLKGESKKKVWNEMLASSEDERRWPAKRVIETGRVTVVSYW